MKTSFGWEGKTCHSVSGWTRGVQVKLWDQLRTRAIPERLRGVLMTRRYTNPHLPYTGRKQCLLSHLRPDYGQHYSTTTVRRWHRSGDFSEFYHDDGSTVDLVLHHLCWQVPAPSGGRLRRSTAVLVAVVTVVGVWTRVGTAVQVDRRIVGQEAEWLEAKSHQRVIDWVERQRWFHRAPAHHHYHHHHRRRHHVCEKIVEIVTPALNVQKPNLA